MKSTGVVRKIDELGRIVLPSEIRRVFGIREGDELDISVDGERVILQKRQDVCVFCSSQEALVDFRDRKVCGRCSGELASLGPVEVRLSEEPAVTT